MTAKNKKAELTKLRRSDTYLLVKITNAVRVSIYHADENFKVGDRLTEEEVAGIDCPYTVKLVDK
tara:strand:- start:1531 stop:1725 length:195 start_codon:yes stop_codon:yes gene_type:complete